MGLWVTIATAQKNMETNSSKSDSPRGEERPHPVSPPAPEKPEVPAAISSTLPEGPSDLTSDPQTKRDEELANSGLSLPRTDGNKPLSEFEKKTVLLGWLGLGIGGFSLLAACVAAVFVYQQWAEINQQTGLMNLAARDARKDSADASVGAAQQVAILQGQLREQQNSIVVITKQMRQDQRPWLRVEFVPIAEAGNDPTKPEAATRITPGQPINVPIRIRNTGKTPAETMTADFVIQLVGINDSMVFPREKGLVKRLRTPPKSTMPPTSQPKILGCHIETGIIFPDSFTETSIVRTGMENGNKTLIPLSLSERVDIISGRVMIYVTGRIEYLDEFGIRHWTDFCRPLSDASANPRCARFNAVDSN